MEEEDFETLETFQFEDGKLESFCPVIFLWSLAHSKKKCRQKVVNEVPNSYFLDLGQNSSIFSQQLEQFWHSITPNCVPCNCEPHHKELQSQTLMYKKFPQVLLVGISKIPEKIPVNFTWFEQ